MSMLAFGDTVLLGRMWTRDTMRYARALKVSMETMIFPTPIGLDSTNFGVQEALNMILKDVKDALNVRFMFNEIYPTIATIIINKAHIILKTPRGG